MVIVTVLVVALVAADLLRSESILRSLWVEFFGPRSIIRRFLDGLRTRGPGVWGR